MEAPTALRRNLSPLQVQLISLGGIIGSCYFLGIGATVAELGPAVVPAFLLGGLIVWLVAMAMGELCVEIPCEGSFVTYARTFVGAPWAAGVGWSYWLNWCAYIASEMIAGGIIMHAFVPAVPVIAWAVVFGGVITSVNLLDVKHFGNVESALALVKIAAIAVFSVLGVVTWLGLTGDRGFLGLTYLTGGRGLAGVFPAGGGAVLLSMVLILVNFQGTELIALSAAETENPRESIALATRKVAVRIVLIFVVPLLILVSVFPYAEGSAAQPLFAAALERSGFRLVAALFTFVALTAALSCANSGLYGTVRALYGLGKEGLAPAWVTRLSASGVPHLATWATILTCWLFLPLYVLFEGTSFYVWLLSVSGFTGAVCWLSISWCRLRFRRRRALTDPAAPSSLWPDRVAIALQLACLGLIPLNKDLRGCLLIGIPAVVLPMAFVWLRESTSSALPQNEF